VDDVCFTFKVKLTKRKSLRFFKESDLYLLLLKRGTKFEFQNNAQGFLIKAPIDISDILKQAGYIKILSFREEAKVLVHACDQGHYGGMMCGKCHADLSYYHRKPLPDNCPNCGVKLGNSVYEPYSHGGSDF